MFGHRVPRPAKCLFGAVASDSTLYRTPRAVTPSVVADLAEKPAVNRADVYDYASGTWLWAAARRVCSLGACGWRDR